MSPALPRLGLSSEMLIAVWRMVPIGLKVVTTISVSEGMFLAHRMRFSLDFRAVGGTLSCRKQTNFEAGLPTTNIGTSPAAIAATC